MRFPPLKIRGARGVMKAAFDAEQSNNSVPEITPFIPLILRGREKETISILRIPPLG